MKCLAIDDESLALELLEDNIRQIPFLELVKCCKNAYEALEILQTEEIDLIFLDIQMPGITGVQFLQGLRKNPMVVFVTAYEEYAIEGFNLDVVDYLLKPVPFERFLKAVTKAKELYELRKSDTNTDTEAGNDFMFVHADYALIRIDYKNILFVEGLKDYVKIYLSTQPQPIITRLTMKGIADKLPESMFFRVHKSYIVALNKIEAIRNQKIKIGNTFVPLSENYSQELFKKINIV
jgi:DNA-binding LytR/AlgR family response regulator